MNSRVLLSRTTAEVPYFLREMLAAAAAAICCFFVDGLVMTSSPIGAHDHFQNIIFIRGMFTFKLCTSIALLGCMPVPISPCPVRPSFRPSRSITIACAPPEKIFSRMLVMPTLTPEFPRVYFRITWEGLVVSPDGQVEIDGEYCDS